MHRMHIVVLAVVFATISVAQAGAGSLAPDPLLASVARVDFTVAGGDFDPIPGLDLAALQLEMEYKYEKAFRDAELIVAKSGDAYLSVTLHHAWDGGSRDKVALLLSLNLWIPARPSGLPENDVEPRSRSLAIWSAQRLELTPSTDAEKVILEALDFALEDFVEARRAAQARVARSS